MKAGVIARNNRFGRRAPGTGFEKLRSRGAPAAFRSCAAAKRRAEFGLRLMKLMEPSPAFQPPPAGRPGRSPGERSLARGRLKASRLFRAKGRNWEWAGGFPERGDILAKRALSPRSQSRLGRVLGSWEKEQSISVLIFVGKQNMFDCELDGLIGSSAWITGVNRRILWGCV